MILQLVIIDITKNTTSLNLKGEDSYDDQQVDDGGDSS
jgi:hypothetical protein